MFESRQPKPVPPWLEAELKLQLRPVVAPDSLWGGIRDQRLSRRPISLHWALWPVAATAALLCSFSVFRQIDSPANPSAELEQLTQQELQTLASGSQNLDLVSCDPGKVRSWVNARAGVDIKLPGNMSPGGPVSLLGASLLHLRGNPIALVAFRLGDGAAALMVARKLSAATSAAQSCRHLFARTLSTGTPPLVSCSIPEQTYAVAWSSARDPQGACLLCHAD